MHDGPRGHDGTLAAWARAWGVPPQALDDLATRLTARPTVAPAKAESHVLNLVRLAASDAGWTLFRNNVGACYDANGRFIRYGLANDSAQLNAALKSSDLVGFRRVLIDPTWIGRHVAQFVALECKAAKWKFRGTERERAQEKFLALIESNGGYARFTTGAL